MIKYLITLVLLLLIYYFIKKNNLDIDNFCNNLTSFEGVTYVHLYTNKGEKLNVALINKPFSTDSDYKAYLTNKNKYIYLGITSYMEFPSLPSNPLDNYKVEDFTNTNPYHLEMYFSLCEGWLHCFRDPVKFIPVDKPYALISESDFVNYKGLVPDNTEKEYDFIYSCPKVSSESKDCFDWVSYNKNWELALKCLPILCEKFKLKGLLVGRQDCDIPKGSEPYITTTGWVDYSEMVKLYQKCKFVFVPNQRDASPRVLTEAMCFDLPILVNYNILGGWKYVNDKTGEFFTSEKDLENSLTKFLANFNNYKPRQYIIDNYGPRNSGIKLKEFLLENFKDRLNITDMEYVTIRHPMINY